MGEFGTAAILDVETTGLSPYKDEIIELCIILFSFGCKTGEVTILDQYTGLREPSVPIHKAASKVHGLTEEVLQGKSLNNSKILSLIKQADFIIAHNASFDYGFVSKMFIEAAAKPWLCSLRGINWKQKGFAKRSLQLLLEAHGIRPKTRHRAKDDAMATLSLISQKWGESHPYLVELLQSGLPGITAKKEIAAAYEQRRVYDL